MWVLEVSSVSQKPGTWSPGHTGYDEDAGSLGQLPLITGELPGGPGPG